MRRTRHADGAQTLIVDAAQHLQSDTGLVGRSQRSLYAELLATAAYTASLRNDRDTAWTLMGEADTAGASLSGVVFGRPELAAYKISVARVLGDFGTAVDHARSVNPAQLTLVDRRARYWEDTALALHGRGRSGDAFRVLLAAEAGAPQEVRYRPWAQDLTTSLLRRPGPALPGIRELASRIGVQAA
jgi:hypothetical protein